MEYRIPSSKLWSHNIWSFWNQSLTVGAFLRGHTNGLKLQRIIYRFNFRSQKQGKKTELWAGSVTHIHTWLGFGLSPPSILVQYYQWLIVSRQMKMIWKESKIGNEWPIGKASAFCGDKNRNVNYTGKDTVAYVKCWEIIFLIHSSRDIFFQGNLANLV